METKTLNQMKGSESYSIAAAVYEIVEKAGFETKNAGALKLAGELEEGKEERWMMEFSKKEITIDELNSIRKELGNSFSIAISVSGKSEIRIRIEASSTDFFAILQKKGTQPNLFNSPGGENKG